jgi:hypothetical protein
MGAGLALLAAAVAFVFVLLPLFRRDAAGAGAGSLGELLIQRDLALDAIRELDFDHDLGNLSEEDHEAMREESKRHAVAILRQLQTQESRIDTEIEQAVAALRSESSAGCD